MRCVRQNNRCSNNKTMKQKRCSNKESSESIHTISSLIAIRSVAESAQLAKTMAWQGGWGQANWYEYPDAHWGQTTATGRSPPSPRRRSRSKSRRPRPPERGNWRANQFKALEHQIRALRKSVDQKETDYKHEARLYKESYGDRTGRFGKSQTALIGAYENLRDAERRSSVLRDSSSLHQYRQRCASTCRPHPSSSITPRIPEPKPSTFGIRRRTLSVPSIRARYRGDQRRQGSASRKDEHDDHDDLPIFDRTGEDEAAQAAGPAAESAAPSVFRAAGPPARSAYPISVYPQERREKKAAKEAALAHRISVSSDDDNSDAAPVQHDDYFDDDEARLRREKAGMLRLVHEKKKSQSKSTSPKVQNFLRELAQTSDKQRQAAKRPAPRERPAPRGSISTCQVKTMAALPAPLGSAMTVAALPATAAGYCLLCGRSP